MYGTHSPYHLSEDLKYESRSKKVTRTEQGIGCLKIVSEYLEQMKELGIYDSATIIITADHGQASLLNSDKDSGKPDDISSPLFLVKLPYAESETMSVCNAPVSQQELMPTIMASIGVDKSEYGSGRCFDEIGENESRERNCVDIWSNYVIQYTINGDVRDLNSWNIENVSYNN
jgi:membrane-anchored protein YejM (alkaline phosphatase superfamily)